MSRFSVVGGGGLNSVNGAVARTRQALLLYATPNVRHVKSIIAAIHY